jgi:hypothetical protein
VLRPYEESGTEDVQDDTDSEAEADGLDMNAPKMLHMISAAAVTTRRKTGTALAAPIAA